MQPTKPKLQEALQDKPDLLNNFQEENKGIHSLSLKKHIVQEQYVWFQIKQTTNVQMTRVTLLGSVMLMIH